MSNQAEECVFVCNVCIGDRFLSQQACEGGQTETCHYCCSVREAMPLYELAEHIHEVLQKYFKLTPENPSMEDQFLERVGIRMWERGGDPVSWMIAGIADLRDDVAEDVRDWLHGSFERWAHENSLENPYDLGACYEEREADPGRFLRMWKEYDHKIRSDKQALPPGSLGLPRSVTLSGAKSLLTRCFDKLSMTVWKRAGTIVERPCLPPQATETLNEVFGDLDSYRTFTNEPIVREISAGGEDRFVWRARRAESLGDLKKILKSPVAEMGPPPPKVIKKGGRMNAEGVSMFYGAFEKDTCIAEIRPFVGSPVVVAQFELVRNVRLLDFDSLASIDDEAMYFDPDYAERRSRAAFFRWLHDRIGRPVMPQDEEQEYVATQVMAEFLGSKDCPRLDGIIYRSSQTQMVGRNLALFDHASEVQETELPGPGTFDILMPDFYDDQQERETIHLLAEECSQASEPGSLHEALCELEPGGCIEDSPSCASESEPTLRLNEDSTFVHYVRGVKYTSDTYEVRWSSLANAIQVPSAETNDEDFNDLLF